MKVITTVIALLLLLSTSKLSAQGKDRLPARSYLGIKAGGNFSFISGDSWDNGIKSNLVGGAYVGIKGLSAGIQAEALFAQSEYTTGNSFHHLYGAYFNNIGDSLKQGSFRVNQLCIPLLLQFKIGPGLWLQLGGQYTGIVSVEDVDALLKDARSIFKTSNLAGIAGATFNLGKVNIGARYIFDFSNANNSRVDEVWKQKAIQAHIGLRLF